MSIKKNIFAPLASGLGATRRAAMLLLVMMLTMTQAAWAQTTITPTTPSQDGDGYYLIGNAAELYGFAGLVNNGNATANAKLTADIVVNEHVLAANGEANTGDFVQWTPIGNDYFKDKVYSGTFDGQGHTVSGLYVSGNGWNVGFVGRVSGTAVVKNLGIVDSYFSSSNNFLGSIVGGVANNSSVTLANVYSTSTVKGENYIGGLVGSDGTSSVTIINSYFAGKTSANWAYGSHHDDLVSGDFDRSTLTVCNAFVLGTSQYGTSVTAEQMSDGTVAAALHYYQDALADGSMFGLSGGKTNFSGTIDGVSVPTANITLHTFTGDTKTYSSKYIVGNTTPLPVNVEREGYTFFGWYDNADLEGDAVTSISSSETDDKEYWAKFERSHAVSFVLGGGTIRSGEIDHYIEGETTALPTMVFKNGASFEGWYTTEDFTGSRYYSIPSTATEDMTFYAKWGAEKTTFYLMQGGSPEPVSILYEGESIVWLDETTVERYVIYHNEYGYWGSDNYIDVPYDGGEYAFSNSGNRFIVAQSGFYVFTLTDKGEGNWFVSVLKSMLNCDVASIPTQTYTGSAIEPVVTVKDGETTLTLGTDYEVAYSNNVNAGTATVTITGKGNYSGETAATFTIVKSMTNDGITITIPEQTYMGSELTPVITVKDGETVLAENTNYTVTAPSVTVQDAGNYTYTITGAGYYAGSREVLFTIAKATPTVTAPTAVENLKYKGSPQALVNAGNTDFGTLLYSTDGTNYSADIPTGTDAGTYTVYYKVEESDNWNAVAAQTIEATIAPGLYTVSFDANGGSGDAMESMQLTYDGDWAMLPACTYTAPDGKAFKNWNTAADGTGTAYDDKDWVRNLTDEPNGNVVLYAQWGKDIAVCSATVPDQTMGGYSYIFYKFESANNDAELAATLGIEVKDGNRVLVLGTDYEFGQVVYASTGEGMPENVGDECLLEIKGKGDYAGSLWAPFTITVADNGGTWGQLTWAFHAGTLTISGTGAMDAASNYSGYPWLTVASYIKAITIGEGVTTIASEAFAGTSQVNYFSNVQSVSLPSTLETIGDEAFAYCTSLTVTIPTGVTIGVNAFNQVGCVAASLQDAGDNAGIIDLMADAMSDNVTLSGRTLYKDGSWNTLTLPFSLSTAQIAANANFAGATLMTMDVTKKNGFDTTDGTLYLWFKTATEIEAGVPYLVKWEKATDYDNNPSAYDISNPVFEGVTVSRTEAQTVESETTGLETVQMVGTYSPVSVTADDKSILFLGDANTLYYSTVDRQIRSCRAYFSVPYINGHAGAKARAFALSFDGEVTTGIIEVSANYNGVTDDAWYSLDGVRLSGKPTQRGMYINKGKKIIVK